MAGEYLGWDASGVGGGGDDLGDGCGDEQRSRSCVIA